MRIFKLQVTTNCCKMGLFFSLNAFIFNISKLTFIYIGIILTPKKVVQQYYIISYFESFKSVIICIFFAEIYSSQSSQETVFESNIMVNLQKCIVLVDMNLEFCNKKVE